MGSGKPPAGEAGRIDSSDVSRCGYLSCRGGDHFSLLADKDSVLEKLNILHEAVSQYVKDSSVELKAGLFITRNDKTAAGYNFRDNLFDLAKVAADSIKKDSTRFYAEYNDMMGEKTGGPQLSDAPF